MLKTTLLIVLLNALVIGTKGQLIIATYQYDKQDRVDNMMPVAKLIAKTVGELMVLRSYPTVHELIEGVQKNEVDIAIISTFGYLLLESEGKSFNMQPLVTWKLQGSAKDNYKCAFISSKNLALVATDSVKNAAFSLDRFQQSPNELSLLLVSRGSTSGNLIPRLALNSIGIKSPESQFKSVNYGGTHQLTAQYIAEGKADIGAIGSTAYFDFIKEHPGSLNLIWLSPEIPLGPVLVKRSLPAKTKDKIAKLLKELHQTDADAFESIKSGWTEAISAESFTATNAEHYKNIFDQFGSREDLKNIMNDFLK